MLILDLKSTAVPYKSFRIFLALNDCSIESDIWGANAAGVMRLQSHPFRYFVGRHGRVMNKNIYIEPPWLFFVIIVFLLFIHPILIAFVGVIINKLAQRRVP